MHLFIRNVDFHKEVIINDDTIIHSFQIELLPATKLPGGSKCQVEGCFLDADATTYWVIKGDSCTIPGLVWSNCTCIPPPQT